MNFRFLLSSVGKKNPSPPPPFPELIEEVLYKRGNLFRYGKGLIILFQMNGFMGNNKVPMNEP